MIYRSVGVAFLAALTLLIYGFSIHGKTVLASSDTALLADPLKTAPINASNWLTGSLFSGYTDKGVPMSIGGGSLNIGPLSRNISGSHYNGLVSKTTYNFNGAYAYVEVVQAPSLSTKADAMLTIGLSVNDFYRIYIEGGNLIGQKIVNGVKTQLFASRYDAVNDKFLEIRHDPSTGDVLFETALDAGGGAPGVWTTAYSEVWNTAAVPLSSVQFEIKAGTWQPESNNPGTVSFANFVAAVASSSSNPPPPLGNPQASVSASPQGGSAPLTTLFTTSASSPNGAIKTYSWTFGDGQTGSGPSVSHLYAATGIFTATLTVTDSAGKTAQASASVAVTPPAASGSSPGFQSAYNVTSTGAVILWTTSMAATSQVQYGLTTAYGSATPVDPSVSTDHSVPLFGLQPGATYKYRTISTTATGQTITSSNMTLTTLSQAPPGLPVLPTVGVDTTMPSPTGTTYSLSSGANVQAALNQAQPGDTIVLQAGAVFNAPPGGLILPPKSNPSNKWIVVRTSDLTDLPADGVRVGPSNAGAMPKILSTGTGAALMTQTGPGSNSIAYWRIEGIEFSVTTNALTNANAPNASANTGLVRLGDPSEGNGANVPHHLVIDRCYIHGAPTMSTIRGVNLNSAYSAVINSYLSDFHGVGWESQAIAGWNGPGPYKINNNYLEGASENVMFGGDDPAIPNLIPSDIEIRKNVFSKPLTWQQSSLTYAGYHWSVKNIFELKNARRVLVMGNTFQNSWVDAQIGYGVSIKSSNADGHAPWSQTLDVTFAANTVENAAIGIQVAARDNPQTIQVTTRIAVIDNLFENINSVTSAGSGMLVRIIGQEAPSGYASSGPTYVTVDHNTGFVSSNNDGMMLEVDDNSPGFQFTNNLFSYCSYAVKGDGTADGDGTLLTYFPAVFFLDNAIVGNPAGAPNFVDFPGNYVPASWSVVQFVNYNNGQGGDYHLRPSSPYKNAGTGRTDIGADVDCLNIASGTGS